MDYWGQPPQPTQLPIAPQASSPPEPSDSSSLSASGKKRGPKKGQNAEFNRKVKEKKIHPDEYFQVMGRYAEWMTPEYFAEYRCQQPQGLGITGTSQDPHTHQDYKSDQASQAASTSSARITPAIVLTQTHQLEQVPHALLASSTSATPAAVPDQFQQPEQVPPTASASSNHAAPANAPAQARQIPQLRQHAQTSRRSADMRHSALRNEPWGNARWLRAVPAWENYDVQWPVQYPRDPVNRPVADMQYHHDLACIQFPHFRPGADDPFMGCPAPTDVYYEMTQRL